MFFHQARREECPDSYRIRGDIRNKYIKKLQLAASQSFN